MLFSCLAQRPRVWVLFIVLGGSATVAAAQTASPPLTLDAAVRQGVTRAPLLTARDADLAAMRDEAVRAGRLPDPSLTFGVSNYPVTDPGAFSLRSDTMTMRTIGVMQAIPSHAARAADRSLAAAQVDAAEAERTATAQDVRERIANAWIGVWAATQQRTLLEALRDESTLAVQVATARLHGGTGSAADVLAAQAEALTLANRIEAADADLQAANASLQRWLGDAPTALADAPDFDQLPVAPDQLEQHTDRQAPMQAWQAREQVADAALAQARAAALQAEADAKVADLVFNSTYPGLPLPERVRLGDEPPTLGGSDAHWSELIVQRSHEIGAADALARQREAEARRARADRLPDPTVGIRVLDDLGGRERAVGLIVSIPIGVRQRGALAAAAGANALAAQAELAMVQRDISGSARESVARARAAYAIWSSRQLALIAARDSANKTERAYTLGESGLAELLVARRGELEAALAERSAVVDAIESVALVRIDAHDLWHHHTGAPDLDEHAGGGAHLPDL